MKKVVFKNLKRSEFVEEAILEKVEHVIQKFPEIRNLSLTAQIEMDNSPSQAGADVFSVKVILVNQGMKPIVVQKHASSPYIAAGLMAESLMEVLHRSLEKRRGRFKAERRYWKEHGHLIAEEYRPAS